MAGAVSHARAVDRLEAAYFARCGSGWVTAKEPDRALFATRLMAAGAGGPPEGVLTACTVRSWNLLG